MKTSKLLLKNKMFTQTETKKTLAIGKRVEHKKYGKGIVIAIDFKTISDKTIDVYFVRFENGDVRHFTGAEIK